MKANAACEMPAEVRDLVVGLHSADKTCGKPVVHKEQLALAREWLSCVLVDSGPWIAHRELLNELYQAKFRQPLPRGLTEGRPLLRPDAALGFRYAQLLPTDEAESLATRGPDDYPPDKLACLLLNPLALWDVSDLIAYTLSSYWLPRIDTRGRELITKHGLDVSSPIPDPQFVPAPEPESETRTNGLIPPT
jgi:hypothetical protein